MGDDLPLAEFVHAMPGRARLRISDRQGDAGFFSSLATSLSAIAGVSKVSVTPLTGSVLIQHVGPLSRIGAAAAEARLFAVGEPAPAAPPASGPAIDPKIMLSLALCGAAAWQLSKDRVLPPALTLLWYASNLGGLWSSGDVDLGE